MIAIPGRETLRLDYLVTDFNGTLACDGALLPGVEETLRRLADHLSVRVLTADTFGRARETLAGMPCELVILSPGAQDSAKRRYVENGPTRCVCIGNGRNDRMMLAAAALGIVVMQTEGAALDTILAAAVAAPDIHAALGLLLNPARLIATLRV